MTFAIPHESMRVQSVSAVITQRVGAQVARYIASLPLLKDGPVIVLLKGDLGAGKTTFVRGFLRFFGVRPYGASPTFVLMKHYKRRAAPDIYHLDAYRLSSKKDLDVLGFQEILRQKNAVILIEWPEKIRGTRYPHTLSISFSYGKNEHERVIKIG